MCVFGAKKGPGPFQCPERRFGIFDNVPVDKLWLKNERLIHLDYLVAEMIDAGNEFGNDTPYESALIQVGQSGQGLKYCLSIIFKNIP